MAILTPQPVPVSGGLTPAPGPAARPAATRPRSATSGSCTWPSPGRPPAPAPFTVAVATPGTVRGLAVADVSATPAAGQVWVLPLVRAFRNPSTRRAAVTTYDDATDVFDRRARTRRVTTVPYRYRNKDTGAVQALRTEHRGLARSSNWELLSDEDSTSEDTATADTATEDSSAEGTTTTEDSSGEGSSPRRSRRSAKTSGGDTQA